MKLYSVHSHKGGVGKTTFSLFLGKYLAQIEKEKTCMIDLDFQAQGLRSIYLEDNLVYDFSDFLLSETKKKKEIAGQIAIQHKEVENLYFIVSHFKPQADISSRLEILKKMYIKLANEIYTHEITDNLLELFIYLEKAGFQNIIIDDHPGLILLSEAIIKRMNTTPLFCTTDNIVSFLGLFKDILERAASWKINMTALKIILNRTPTDFSLQQLAQTIDTLLESNDVSADEKLVCATIKKDILSKPNGLMIIGENENIRNIETIINPKTILSLEIPPDLRQVAKSLISSQTSKSGGNQ